MMPQSNNRSLSRKVLGGVFWKFSECILAQLISTIVAIILARILLPEDYAVVSVVTIFFAFCSLFIRNGLSAALIQKKDSDALDYSTILYSNLTIASLLYIVMFFVCVPIANLYEQPLLIPIMRVMGLNFFINGTKAVVYAKITNDLRFKMFFAATLTGTIVSAVLGISMALNGFGAWALVVQQTSNSFIDTVILLFLSRIKFVLRFSQERFKKLFNYGFKIFLAGLISTIYEEIRPLIVGLRFSTTDLAYYNKGMQYPQIISNTMNDTLSSVLFPVMSKVQEDTEAVQAMTRRFICVCSFVVFPAMLGLFAVSDNLIVLLLTDKWSPIIIYVKIFSVSFLFTIIQKGNLLPIRAIGRSDLILKLDIIKKSIYLFVLVGFIIFSKTPQILATMGVLTNLIAFLINSYANQKTIKYKVFRQVADVASNLIPAIIMCVFVSYLNMLSVPRILLLGIQIVAGITIYLALNLIFKNPSFFYLLDFTKKFFGKSLQ